jgi:hypothetical protein
MRRCVAGILAVLAAGLAGAQGTEGKPVYEVKRAEATPDLKGDWEGPVWQHANELRVETFYTSPEAPQSGKHKPVTRARALYDDKGIYIHFKIDDRYVRCIETEYHGKVWEDACAEFFVQPKAERGYFNFEINCGGTMLLSYHENPEWKGAAQREEGSVPEELASQVKIFHTMPKKVDPEIEEPVTWQLEYFIPFSLLEEYVGELGGVSKQSWRANFYKCAENNSHPHWASWSPITGKLDFHQPEFFGVIRFE